MKYGAAHVDGLYDVPYDGNQFTNGATATAGLGLTVLRVYATQDYLTKYPLQTAWSNESAANIKQLLQTTEYDTVLTNPTIDTFVITTYAFGNPNNNWWRTGVDSVRLGIEYTEVYDAAVYLLTNYDNVGKTFLFSNWEGDWAFMDSFDPATFIERQQVDNYVAFYRTRQRAVEDARRNTPHKNVTVLNVIEANKVLDTFTNPARRRIVTDILPRIKPDAVGYSAYDSTIDFGYLADQAAWEAAVTDYFTKCLRRLKAAVPPGTPIYIGECGFPENEIVNDHTGHDISDMIQKVKDIALAEGLKYLIYWEIFDNEVSIPYTYRGYFLIKADGSTSLAGTKMASF